MLSKSVIFLAILCVVNAYVIEVDTVRLSDARSCNNQECEQSCRRIGFPGGVCVNDRCKCDILLKTEDNEIHIAPVAEAVEGSSEKVVAMEPSRVVMEPSRKEMEPSREEMEPSREAMEPRRVVMPTPRACFAWQCINTCRAAGYLNGYCQFNSCICY